MRLVIIAGPELRPMFALFGRGMKTFVFITADNVRAVATLTKLELDKRPRNEKALIEGTLAYCGEVYHFCGHHNAVGAGIFELGAAVNVPVGVA